METQPKPSTRTVVLAMPPLVGLGGAGLTAGRWTFGLQRHVRLDYKMLLPQHAPGPFCVQRLVLHKAQVSPQAAISPTRVCSLELPDALQEALDVDGDDPPLSRVKA
jgi:hypothetical protein